MHGSKLPTIGVAVITHCAKKHLQRCLPPLLGARERPRIIVVNSSSGDGTVEEAERLGAETLVVQRAEFNHGTTRELARRRLGTDLVVMVTPDAYAVDEKVLGLLVEPLLDGRAQVAYARQIPHDGAGFFEAFPRRFNYPEQSHLRGLEDADEYGVYTIFCSNTFAAYRNAALDEIGGFRATLTHEDTFAVAELLMRGYKIAYVAEAVVRHSHSYSLLDEFRRYFDTGHARALNGDLVRMVGGDERRGRQFTVALLSEVARERPGALPYAIAQTGAKWLGYRIGSLGSAAPDWIKRRLSGQDYYWSSVEYRKARAAARH